MFEEGLYELLATLSASYALLDVVRGDETLCAFEQVLVHLAFYHTQKFWRQQRKGKRANLRHPEIKANDPHKRFQISPKVRAIWAFSRGTSLHRTTAHAQQLRRYSDVAYLLRAVTT